MDQRPRDVPEVERPLNRERAERIVQQNDAILKRFIQGYVWDNGVGVYLIAAIAKDLFGQRVVFQSGEVPAGVADTPIKMLEKIIKDLTVPGDFQRPAESNLERTIAGAASLSYVVRTARLVDAEIIPPEVIPGDDVVRAALWLFHRLPKRTTSK